jgi:GNAT superfamily N-acetyltransferase
VSILLIFTTDKKRLLEHFRKDPVMFAYHMGDLDDFFFLDCIWPAVLNARGSIDEVLLTYLGGDTPTLQAFGLTERFVDLLRIYLPIAPPKFFCHYQKQYGPVFREYTREIPLGSHMKMRLDESEFRKRRNHPVDDAHLLRLNPSQEQLLRTLYAAAYPDSYFSPRMLQTGKFFGYFDKGAIVAVAGVHVVSDKYRVAALGNIATHPDYRGRGLATLVTHRLTAELVSEGTTLRQLPATNGWVLYLPTSTKKRCSS